MKTKDQIKDEVFDAAKFKEQDDYKPEENGIVHHWDSCCTCPLSDIGIDRYK